MGRVSWTKFNAGHQVVESGGPGLPTATFLYELTGQTKTVTVTATGPSPQSRTQQLLWSGQQVLTGTSAGTSDSVAQFAHDAAGRVTEITFADAKKGYTPRAATGAVAAVVPPSADPPAPAGAPWGSGPPTYTFDRGPGGLLAKESLPAMPPWLVWETSYVYDADLDLTQETRNDGKKFTYTRHPTSGQLLNFTVPDDAQDGATLWSLYYEPTGARRLERIVHNSNTLLYSYAGALPASEMWESGNLGGAIGATVERQWDNRLRPTATKVIQPAAATIVATTTEKVAFDHDNLPAAITLHGADDTKLVDLQLQRDAATGQLTKLVVNAEPGVANPGKVLDVDYTYNGFGEPASVTVVDPQPLQELEYSETYLERDAVGRVAKRVVDGAGIAPVEHVYTYHAQRGWLETHSKNGVLSDKWTYDQRGNRTGQKVGLTGQTTASHDAHDRLLQSGAETFGYDLQGRVVSRSGGAHNATYTWDAFGHLRHATLTPSQQSATDVEYRLDPAGRRIRSRALDANDTALEDHSWVYDGDLRVIAQLTDTGKLQARYLYATLGHSPDVAVTFHTTTGAVTGVYLLVHDQVGSVVRTLDVADGSAVESVEYDAWGVATVSPGGTSVHPFGFAGGLWDRRTGLVRFGAREYDAGIGRWLGRDPIGFGGGWNHYGYAGGDPVGRVDPDGLFVIIALPAGAAGAEYLLGLGGAFLGGWFLHELPGLLDQLPWPSWPDWFMSDNGEDSQPDCAKRPPRPSPKFEPPTNDPRLPPDPGTLPPGFEVRKMRPTEQYPDGYWVVQKQIRTQTGGTSTQPVNPNTYKPGPKPDTHVPFPPGFPW